MTREAQQQTIERYIAAYNAFDIDGMLAVVHPELEFRNVSGGEVNAETTGVEPFRQLAEASKGLFASRCQTITRLDIRGEAATAEIDYHGVLAVDLPNGMKAGDTLRLQGRSEFEFRDGKLSRISDYS